MRDMHDNCKSGKGVGTSCFIVLFVGRKTADLRTISFPSPHVCYIMWLVCLILLNIVVCRSTLLLPRIVHYPTKRVNYLNHAIPHKNKVLSLLQLSGGYIAESPSLDITLVSSKVFLQVLTLILL